jgi:hypothetical protein
MSAGEMPNPPPLEQAGSWVVRFWAGVPSNQDLMKRDRQVLLSVRILCIAARARCLIVVTDTGGAGGGGSMMGN